MTKSFALHRSNGVRVSPCFQIDGVEGEEEKELGQELPAGASDGRTRPAIGAALPGWQTARNGDGTCLREKERSTGVGVGWERRKELGQGPENGIDRRK